MSITLFLVPNWVISLGDVAGMPGLLYYDDLQMSDETMFKLGRIVRDGVGAFIYEYDLGDSWQHELLVEKTIAMWSGSVLSLPPRSLIWRRSMRRCVA